MVPAMLAVRLGVGVSTQGGDQVQQLRKVWELQIEGVVAPITSLHSCHSSVLLWVNDRFLSSAAGATWMTPQSLQKTEKIIT